MSRATGNSNAGATPSVIELARRVFLEAQGNTHGNKGATEGVAPGVTRTSASQPAEARPAEAVREHLAEHGWVVIRSRVLGGERVLLVWASDAEIPEEVSDLPRYTRDEVERLAGADPETLRAVHAVKVAFPGAVVLPAGETEATA